MPQKPKASKMSRKDVVIIERAVQMISENVYRIRAKLAPGLDEDLTEPDIMQMVRKADASLNAINEATFATMSAIRELPVLEDME